MVGYIHLTRTIRELFAEALRHTETDIVGFGIVGSRMMLGRLFFSRRAAVRVKRAENFERLFLPDGLKGPARERRVDVGLNCVDQPGMFG